MSNQPNLSDVSPSPSSKPTTLIEGIELEFERWIGKNRILFTDGTCYELEPLDCTLPNAPGNRPIWIARLQHVNGTVRADGEELSLELLEELRQREVCEPHAATPRSYPPQDLENRQGWSRGGALTDLVGALMHQGEEGQGIRNAAAVAWFEAPTDEFGFPEYFCLASICEVNLRREDDLLNASRAIAEGTKALTEATALARNASADLQRVVAPVTGLYQEPRMLDARKACLAKGVPELVLDWVIGQFHTVSGERLPTIGRLMEKFGPGSAGGAALRKGNGRSTLSKHLSFIRKILTGKGLISLPGPSAKRAGTVNPEALPDQSQSDPFESVAQAEEKSE